MNSLSFQLIAPTLGCLLTGAAIWLIAGRFFIHLSNRWGSSTASNRAPKRHQNKNGTPVTGGLFIMATTACSLALWAPFTPMLWWQLAVLLLFGSIGAADDWYKIKSGAGLHARTKFILQWSCAAFLLITWQCIAGRVSTVYLPFINITLTIGSTIATLWGMFVMVAMSNAVNLTDGLDGLASTQLITAFIALTYCAYTLATPTPSLIFFSSALIGSLLGFLWYNTHPATLFMGDAGALGIGASLASMALCMHLELILPFIGIIFVAETVSVILQVASIRLRSKRLFNMAPIHHHFEIAGWHESQIVMRFLLITLLSSLAAVLLIFSR